MEEAEQIRIRQSIGIFSRSVIVLQFSLLSWLHPFSKCDQFWALHRKEDGYICRDELKLGTSSEGLIFRGLVLG